MWVASLPPLAFSLSLSLVPSPSQSLSMQCQQNCQNICGCYGDGYKELTRLLLRVEQREKV
uniref:Uncharacterized protein n=1 Tax=Anguilla anguilla TaxID=7936 RepID=A0A0E9R9L1_ANGAN